MSEQDASLFDVVVFGDDHEIVLFSEFPNGTVVDRFRKDRSDVVAVGENVLDLNDEFAREVLIKQ